MKKTILKIIISFVCIELFAMTNPSKTISASKQKKQNQPIWITKPYSNYNEKFYLTGVGVGSDDNSAIEDAKSQLIKVLNQKIEATEKVKTYANSKTEFSEYSQDIKTVSAIKELSGLKIVEKYYDNNNQVFALAVLERQDAADYYAKLVKKNNSQITEYLEYAKSNPQKFQSLVYANKTLKLSNEIDYYVDLIFLIAAPFEVDTSVSYKNQTELIAEVEKIKAKIPIQIKVEGDEKKTFETAIKKDFEKLGILCTDQELCPYTLIAKIKIQNPDSPDEKHFFCNYEYTVELVSAKSEQVFNYSTYGRAGHINKQGAINKAKVMITNDLETSFFEELSRFLENGEQ